MIGLFNPEVNFAARGHLEDWTSSCVIYSYID